MHSFTGCNTVSAFAGKGKTSALKLLTTNGNIQHMFCRLGEEWDLSPQFMNELEPFTCLLYDPKDHQLRSVTFSTTFSVQRKVKSKATNFHHAGTAWRNTPNEPTTKQAYAEGVWSKIRKCQALLAEGGRSIFLPINDHLT